MLRPILNIKDITKAHNIGVKSSSYALGKKLWLNSNYSKIKQNQKLENMLFDPFQVLHIIKKQAYKLEVPIK